MSSKINSLFIIERRRYLIRMNDDGKNIPIKLIKLGTEGMKFEICPYPAVTTVLENGIYESILYTRHGILAKATFEIIEEN